MMTLTRRSLSSLSACYRLFQMLSLDVVLGALCGAGIAATVLSVTVDPTEMASLGLAIWIVYTADHLVDGWRQGPGSLNARHRFHARHRVWLGPAVLVAALVLAWLCYGFLNEKLVALGLFAGGLCVLHIIIVQKRQWSIYPKEFVIALLYSSGVWLASILKADGLSMADLATISMFFIAAFGNLIVFSAFDRRVDAVESPNNMVQRWGKDRCIAFIHTLAILGGLCGMVAVLRDRSIRNFLSALVLTIACVWPLILWKVRWFHSYERYRPAGDAVFYLYSLPFVYSLLAEQG